jgi:hypothetical protein
MNLIQNKKLILISVIFCIAIILILSILYIFTPDISLISTSPKPTVAASARLSNVATPPIATPITNLIITDGEGNMSNAKTIEVDDTSSISRIQTPNGNLKINNQGIMFGGLNNNNDLNSCQISAGVHDKDAMCIIGLGTPNTKRKVKVWDNLDVSEYTKSSKYRIGDKWVISGIGDAHQKEDDWLRLFGSDEKGYYGGLAAGKLYSDGNIHIRNTNSLCIGGTCINENHLKMLTEGFWLAIRNARNGNSHYRDYAVHTHNNGNIAAADWQWATLYQPIRPS